MVKLWAFTAVNKPDGHLTNMDASDICEIMEFKGNPRAMIHALLDCTSGADSIRSCPGCDVCEKGKKKKRAAWLDKTSIGFYRVHDWDEHNPYASKAPVRISIAKKGAAARWQKKTNQEVAPCSSTERALLPAQQGNAPAPAPSPVPSPSPIRESGEAARSIAAPRRIDEIAFGEAEKAWTILKELLGSPMQDKFVVSDPVSRKIVIDLGGRDRLVELHAQGDDRLHQEFITRYAFLEKANYKSKAVIRT